MRECSEGHGYKNLWGAGYPTTVDNNSIPYIHTRESPTRKVNLFVNKILYLLS